MCGKNYLLTTLTVVCSLLCTTLFAQQKESREIFYRIGYAAEITPDSSVAVIYGGKKQFVEVGLTGPVNSKYDDKDKLRSEEELGFGSVVRVTDTTAVIAIRPKTKHKIKIGDYIKLTVKVPKLPYRSIWFELACLDIDFKNLYKDNLYTFTDLLYNDSKNLEDSLLKASASDVFNTWDYLRDDTSFTSLRTPLKEGRYKSRTVGDVMDKCTPKDVLAFLHFVRGYPGKYIGNSWKINETFATWVLNNAPYSQSEILDSVATYRKNPTALKRFIETNSRLLVKDEYVRNWISKAIDEQNRGNQQHADYLLEIARLTLTYLIDDCGSGFYYYAKAQILQNRNNYKLAIPNCDTAYNSFVKCQNHRFATESLFKKAYCLRQISKGDEALVVYEKITALLNDNSLNFETEKNRLAAKCKREIGYVWENKGEYKKAIEYFVQAISAYQAINTYDALNDAASLQLSLANIYKNQGEYAKALEIYQQQLKSYRFLGDKSNEADVLDNIGYIESKLGNYRNAIINHNAALQLHLFLNHYNDAGYAQSQIGQSIWNLGNYDSAIVCHLQALQYRKQANSLSGQAYSFRKLASLYSVVGKKNMALDAYDSTAHYYELAKDSTRLIENLQDVGDVYKEDKQFQKAFQYYSKAHALRLLRGKKSEIVDSYYKLADAAYNFDTAASAKNYLACYELAKQIGDKSNMLYSSLNLGLLAARRFDYKTSDKFYKEGLQLAIAEKSKSDEAWAYARMADGIVQKMEYDEAIALYNKAAKIYDSLGDKSKTATVYSSIGYAVGCKGDLAGSLSYYERTKEIGAESKNLAHVASALSSMSFVYSLFGEHAKALSCVDSALQIFKSLDNQWQIANTYMSMGSVYSGMGDFNKAITYHMRADSLFKLEKDELSRSMTQNNIGVVYYFQADYDRSLSYFMEADRLAKIQNTTNESNLITKQNIGEIYLTKKQFDLAAKYLSEVNKISKEKNLKRTLGGSSLLLGKLEFEKKKLDEALKYFQEAKTHAVVVNETDRVIECELFLSKTYAAKNDPKALPHLQTAVALAKKTGSKYLWEVLYELGINLYNQNNYDSAINYFKDAVADIDNTSSKLFGGAEAKKVYAADERKVDLYAKLVASLAKVKRADEALFYADKSNSQAIKEKMERSGIVTADKEKNEALKKGNELLQKQTAIEQAIAKEKAKPEQERNQQLITSLEGVKKVAEEDYLNFIDELVAKYPDLNSYFSKTNPNQFRNFIDYIPDSTIVVLYVINDKQLFIFTVTNQETGIKVVDLPEDLNAKATKFLNLVKNPDNATGTGAITVRATIKDKNTVKGDFKKEATTLYNLLITPIEDQLKDKTSLCIIPNSKLSAIPFAALGYVDNTNQFHFLIENYRLFYTNKMEIFSKPYKPQSIEQSFVAFGNPDKSLPGATKEVLNIQQIFPSATIFLEENATETKAKDAIKSYSFVHFATHGILDGDDFSKSYLLFNSDANNDGKLSIAEVNGLIKKETSMVFLSACDMAVSQETTKGWYISPINAFLNNRVTTGVGPLWQVPDEATMILLDEFYKNIKYHKMSRTDALRHAQATLSKNPKYAHPYFWGAFVLYGEWR